MYVCVGVHPHVCLLIGRVVARTAVQREGGALPLAMLGHVTLEKGLAVCLEPAHVTPGRGRRRLFLSTSATPEIRRHVDTTKVQNPVSLHWELFHNTSVQRLKVVSTSIHKVVLK